MLRILLPAVLVAAAVGMLSGGDIPTAWLDTAMRGPLPETAPADEQRAGYNLIRLERTPAGHFFLEAEVEGRALRFLVDTGASSVVLSPEDTQKLGYRLRQRDFTTRFQSANGIVRAAPVRLDRLRIGQFVLHDVRAHVNERPMAVSLMGMSALRTFARIEAEGDELRLYW